MKEFSLLTTILLFFLAICYFWKGNAGVYLTSEPIVAKVIDEGRVYHSPVREESSDIEKHLGLDNIKCTTGWYQEMVIEYVYEGESYSRKFSDIIGYEVKSKKEGISSGHEVKYHVGDTFEVYVDDEEPLEVYPAGYVEDDYKTARFCIIAGVVFMLVTGLCYMYDYFHKDGVEGGEAVQ